MPGGIGFNIKVPKEMFFDRAKVLAKEGEARVKNLSKIGAFVWKRMKTLTGVRSNKSAPPGKPPRRHSGQLHDLIFFASDGTGVTIGPVVFKKGEAPALLEFGGKAQRRNPKTDKSYTANYKGNPFAQPSLQKEIEAGTVSSAWANSVKN